MKYIISPKSVAIISHHVEIAPEEVFPTIVANWLDAIEGAALNHATNANHNNTEALNLPILLLFIRWKKLKNIK